MSELIQMLQVQARLHKKQGANALGKLFESAIEEIQLLKKNYNQLFDAFQDCQGELSKANERVDGLEKALANCADALYESNINHKKAIDKIQAECIDVLFDFAAKRDDSGFAIALYEQPYEIQDAIRTFKQLSKDQSNG